jgi:hypothetical protein
MRITVSDCNCTPWRPVVHVSPDTQDFGNQTDLFQRSLECRASSHPRCRAELCDIDLGTWSHVRLVRIGPHML